MIDKYKKYIEKCKNNSPSRVMEHSATAIDNVITNLTDVGVSVINTAISDHYGQQVIIISEHKPKREQINIRDTKPFAVLLNSLLNRRIYLLKFYGSRRAAILKFLKSFKILFEHELSLNEISTKIDERQFIAHGLPSYTSFERSNIFS